MIITVRFEQDLFDLKRVLLKVNAWKEFDQQTFLTRSRATQKVHQRPPMAEIKY